MNLTNGEAEIDLTVLFNKLIIPCKIPVATICGKVANVQNDENQTILTLDKYIKVLDGYSALSTLTVQENIDDVSALCAKALEEEKIRNLELLKKYRLSPIG